MESSEKLGYLEWNTLRRHLHIAVPLGYIEMESTEEMGHPGWNQD
jgi:hypothetical protein